MPQINHIWRAAHRLNSARRSCVQLTRPDRRLFMIRTLRHDRSQRASDLERTTGFEPATPTLAKCPRTSHVVSADVAPSPTRGVAFLPATR